VEVFQKVTMGDCKYGPFWDLRKTLIDRERREERGCGQTNRETTRYLIKLVGYTDTDTQVWFLSRIPPVVVCVCVGMCACVCMSYVRNPLSLLNPPPTHTEQAR
jgi:hypothetical protein